MPAQKNDIRPDNELKDVFKHPRAKNVFRKHNMGCLRCGGAPNEKLRHAALCHGLDIEALIREICNHD